MKLLNLQSQNLIVDYISFKFQHLDNSRQTKLAKYLFKIEFNFYQESGRLAKPIKEFIFVSSKNKSQVLFVREGLSWEGTTLQFSGSNVFILLFKKN